MGDDDSENVDTHAPEDRIVTAEDRSWETVSRAGREFRRAKLGDAAGSRRLGCSLHEVPPGERTWPYHFHTANEEALFVLSGEATLRTPEGETTVSAGDYAAFPTGENGAHAVGNDGKDTLRYLVVSTMRDPDVLGYPDSGKVGVYAGSPPGGDEDERLFPGFYREADAVDFWEGEVASDDEDESE